MADRNRVAESKAIGEELLWLGAIAVAASLVGMTGLDIALSAALGCAGYAAWHLTQALRLLAFTSRAPGPAPGSVWGIWRELFDRVASSKRRERRRVAWQRRFFSRLREMASALPDGLVMFGRDGTVSWLNRQAECYLGIDRCTATGRRLRELVDHPVMQEYLDAGDFRRGLDIEAPGDPALVLSILVIRFTKGPRRHLLIARDITRLYHLNRAQQDFTLNVSHELRTPLTVLHGYLETLFDTADEQAPYRTPVLRMMDQTRRMQAVIQDLSVLSTLEAAEGALQHEPVAVLDCLEDIVEDARELARATGHVLNLNGDPGLLLLGDESLLRSAFSNLVFNAIRHTPIRTRVDISWGLDGDHAVVWVQDNGAGIPARHLPRLTERFYRVDSGRSSDRGGSGLGLAIVRQILDMHDAQLQISCTEGLGCRFGCRFPARMTVSVPGDPPGVD
jgi:two-component system phosphate regulon sensor histidine kinase PhoR